MLKYNQLVDTLDKLKLPARATCFATIINRLYPLICIVACISLFLAPALVKKDFGGDFAGYNLPSYFYTFLNFKQGILAFWSPHAQMGIPHLFRNDQMLFHPFGILVQTTNLLFNWNQSIGMFGNIMEACEVILLIFGAIGMYQLLHTHLGISRSISTIVSIFFSLNPFLLNIMHTVTVMAGVVLLPWIFYCILQWLERPTRARFVIVIILNFILFAGGYPYHVVYIFAFEFVVVLMTDKKKIFAYLLSVLITILLASVFLLPALHITLLSSRSEVSTDVNFHKFVAFMPTRLITFINPLVFGETVSKLDPDWLFSSVFISWGSVLIYFLAQGIFSERKGKYEALLIVVFIVSIAYSFGGFFASQTFFGTYLNVILKFRSHWQALFISMFVGYCFIAIGLQEVVAGRKNKAIDGFFVLVIVSILNILFLSSTLFFSTVNQFKEQVNSWSLTFFLITSALVFSHFISRSNRIVVLLLLSVLVLHEYHYYFTKSTGMFSELSYNEQYSKTAASDRFQNESKVDPFFRVHYEGGAWQGYNSSMYDFSLLFGYENVPVGNFTKRTNIYDGDTLLKLSNTKYAVYPEEKSGNQNLTFVEPISVMTTRENGKITSKIYFVYMLKSFLPRFFVPNMATGCDENDLDCQKKNDLPSSVAVLSPFDSYQNKHNDIVTYKPISFKPSQIAVEMYCVHRCFVVNLENFDTGWSLKVNKKESQLYNVANGVMGFYIDKGNNIVELNYYPPQLNLGLFISFMGITFLFVYYKYSPFIPLPFKRLGF